ncbi:MAG: hypothetical protein WD467_00875 [Candidatus Saccharimonadales bacterium]
MSEHSPVTSEESTSYQLAELENANHTLEAQGEFADSSWARQLKADRANNTGVEDEPADKSGKYNRRGDKSRQTHNRQRAAGDPRRNNTQPDPPKYEESKHEQWGRKYFDEHVSLFATRREYGADGSYKEVEVETGESLAALITARASLAEAQVSVRRGKLGFRRSSEEAQLEEAREAYQIATRAYLAEVLADSEASLPQRRALAAIFMARESGALMGEEANYYLTKENSTGKKVTEWYARQNKVTKVVLGIGAIAAGSAVLGAAGGLAAAGGLFGSRLGKGYFTREAKRRSQEQTGGTSPDRQASYTAYSETTEQPVSYEQYQKQADHYELATLLQSNHTDYERSYQTLAEYQKRDGGKLQKIEDEDLTTVASTQSVDLQRRSISEYEAATDQASEVTRRKRRALAGAVGGAAVGFGIGWAIENYDELKDFVSGNDPDTTETTPVPGSGNPEVTQQLDQLESDIAEEAERAEELEAELQQEREREAELTEQLEQEAEAESEVNDSFGESLPEGYIAKTADGYEITAMPGDQTDSLWRAAEHSLQDYLGRAPTMGEVDALQNQLGERWLEVGERVVVTNEQLARATGA